MTLASVLSLIFSSSASPKARPWTILCLQSFSMSLLHLLTSLGRFLVSDEGNKVEMVVRTGRMWSWWLQCGWGMDRLTLDRMTGEREVCFLISRVGQRQGCFQSLMPLTGYFLRFFLSRYTIKSMAWPLMVVETIWWSLAKELTWKVTWVSSEQDCLIAGVRPSRAFFSLRHY